MTTKEGDNIILRLYCKRKNKKWSIYDRKIEKAEHKESGTFDEFLIVPTGEKYDGFWGENGFDKMILLAKRKVEKDFCILTDYSDAFHLCRINFVGFDIPSDLNCVRVFLNEPIDINGVASSVLGYGKDKND